MSRPSRRFDPFGEFDDLDEYTGRPRSHRTIGWRLGDALKKTLLAAVGMVVVAALAFYVGAAVAPAATGNMIDAFRADILKDRPLATRSADWYHAEQE